jgi:hypothetical protein
MVRVRQYEPNVQLRSELRQDLVLQAFGSDVGTGMDNLAKGGMPVAQSLAAVQAIEDEAISAREG